MLTPVLLKPAAPLIEASPRRDKTASISESILTFNPAGNKPMSHWPNSFSENYPCCWSLLFNFCSVLFCLVVLGFEPVISCTLGKHSTPIYNPSSLMTVLEAFIFLWCICVSVFVCVCRCVCMCMHASGSQKLTDSTRLAVQTAPGICLSLPTHAQYGDAGI